jgi:hypothetical protein
MKEAYLRLVKLAHEAKLARPGECCTALSRAEFIDW